MKVYYAHSLHIYGTPQERRDIKMLEDMGFEVVNPASQGFVDTCESIRRISATYDEGSVKIMDYFMGVVGACNLLAFRSFTDNKIGSGVGKEIEKAKELGIPIIELPNLLGERFLDKDQTRLYLQLNGQR